MENSSQKSEIEPPSYSSCVADDVPAKALHLEPLLTVTGATAFDRFIRIVENQERFHFHAPNGMGCCTVPEVVQIRDSAAKPILSIMTGRMIVASGSNRVVSCREIMTPNGEALLSISPGNTQTLSSGDQVLGILDDESLLCRQTLTAKNVMGDVIFEGAGDHSMGDCACICCVECCFGCCRPNSSEFIFSHNGVDLGKLTRSRSNSSGNELQLFNSAAMDPRTKAILIYASYSAFLMFFVDTKCGRIGDRGIGRRVCCSLFIGSLILLSLPLFLTSYLL